MKSVGDDNEVFLNDQGIIVLIAHGHQSIEKNKIHQKKILTLLAAQRDQRRPASLLIDLRQITPADRDPGATLEGKRFLSSTNFNRIAVLGSPTITTIAFYALQTINHHERIKFFTNESKAIRWLAQSTLPTQDLRSNISIIAAITLSVIGIFTLIGWQTSNLILMSWLPHLRPMNPTAALGLIALAFAFYCYWRRKEKALRAMGVLGILLGFSAIAGLPIDMILFADKQQLYMRQPWELADSAAWCFIASGIMGLAAWRNQWWTPVVEYTAAGTIFLLAFFNIFGLLYATDLIYGISPTFAMAFNLACAFAVSAVAFLILILYRQRGDILGQITAIGWLCIIALILIQGATYASWNLAKNRNSQSSQAEFTTHVEETKNNIRARLQAYIEALYGFRGLFAASDKVTQGDFEAYYDSLELEKNHPGLRSISYISAVREQDLNAFVAERRRDTSLLPGGNPHFTIQHKTNDPLHFIATYVAGAPTSSGLGRDVNSIPGRAEIYRKTVESGKLHSSGTITFIATSEQPSEKGFFISVPVKLKDEAIYTGVVNANFNYDDFLPAIIRAAHFDRKNDITVTDRTSGHVIYDAPPTYDSPLTTSFVVPIVEGYSWIVTMSAPTNFGITPSQERTPRATIFSGQFLSLLLLLIFIFQTRARRRALKLADAATADLQFERNNLLELHQKSDAILSSVGDGLIGFDENGKIEFVNRAAEKILGFTQAELVENNPHDAPQAITEHGSPTTKPRRLITQALKQGKTTTTIVTYVRKNGQSFPAQLTIAPVTLNDQTIGAIEVLRDITQDFELDKAKSEFVSLASHQLRTPLSAINWYTEMLLSDDPGVLNENQKMYLKEISQSNKRMIELIGALLDVSRIDLGRMINNPEDTDVITIITTVLKEQHADLAAKQQSVITHLNRKKPIIEIDPKLLYMIVQNLISNAVKYTPPKGSIEITFRNATTRDFSAAKLTTQKPYILFSVKDTGYGIPLDQRDKIFQKLFRADNVKSMNLEGTGLGLYLVKEVTEKLGGRVWFDSIESQGTTFSVILPRKNKSKKGGGIVSR